MFICINVLQAVFLCEKKIDRLYDLRDFSITLYNVIHYLCEELISNKVQSVLDHTGRSE
jgi:hypothetical protein